MLMTNDKKVPNFLRDNHFGCFIFHFGDIPTAFNNTGCTTRWITEEIVIQYTSVTFFGNINGKINSIILYLVSLPFYGLSGTDLHDDRGRTSLYLYWPQYKASVSMCFSWWGVVSNCSIMQLDFSGISSMNISISQCTSLSVGIINVHCTTFLLDAQVSLHHCILI